MRKYYTESQNLPFRVAYTKDGEIVVEGFDRYEKAQFQVSKATHFRASRLLYDVKQKDVVIYRSCEAPTQKSKQVSKYILQSYAKYGVNFDPNRDGKTNNICHGLRGPEICSICKAACHQIQYCNCKRIKFCKQECRLIHLEKTKNSLCRPNQYLKDEQWYNQDYNLNKSKKNNIRENSNMKGQQVEPYFLNKANKKQLSRNPRKQQYKNERH